MAVITPPPASRSNDADVEQPESNNSNTNRWSRRRALVGVFVLVLMLPFCVSNLVLALRSMSLEAIAFKDDDWDAPHQSREMTELQLELNASRQYVKSLKQRMKHMEALASNADDLSKQLDKANAQVKEREAQVKMVESELQKLKDQAKKESPQKKKKSRPNILLLYADDWRYDTLGLENKVVQTPHLDQLAREGIRFTQNCVTTAVCWASRATLLTGLYLARHKTNMPQVWHGNWTESIYELLRQGGYYVGHVGKWGIWDLPLDKVLDYETADEGWHYNTISGKLWHITKKNEHDALEFLETRNKNKPFFLNVAFFATHAMDGDPRQYLPQNESMSLYKKDHMPVPVTATQEEWEKMPWFFTEQNEGRTRWRYRHDTPQKHQDMMKNYYRMATEVDSTSGAIIRKLEEQGELDNTLIIFTTDNGNFHAEHGLADKWYPHQESIRVPLIVRDPRMPSSMSGTLNDEFTLNLDLAPTILKAANVKPPKGMMGRDMSTLYLDQDVTWRNEFYYEHPYHLDKNYIPGSEGLVRKDYKYFLWTDFGLEQFFDIKNDPLEQYDIINSTDVTHQKILKEMKRRFKELRKIVHSNKTVTL